MKISACLLAFAIIAGVASRAVALSPEEQLEAETGIDTPESKSLDKQVQVLLDQAAKARQEAAALMKDVNAKAAHGKFDAKKFWEQVAQGDRSALFVQTPESRRAFALYEQAKTLEAQAAQKTDEAAEQRADAAMKKRCIEPSSSPQKQNGDPLASTYLCSAVRVSGSSKGPVDPWEVCSCLRRYVAGLRKDYADLLTRVLHLVGQREIEHAIMYGSPNGDPFAGSDTEGTVITTESIDQEFGKPYRIPDKRNPSEDESISRAVQIELAQDRLRVRLNGKVTPAQYLPKFSFDTDEHYDEHYLIQAIAELWRLYLSEARLRLGILEQENLARHKRLFDAFDAADQARYHPDQNHGDVTAWLIAMKPLARQNDELDYQYIDETGQKLAALVTALRQVRRRLTHDIQDWTKFAGNNGKEPSIAWAHDPNRPVFLAWPPGPNDPVTFEIYPSRHDPVHCCLRMIDYAPNGVNATTVALDSAAVHLWANFPQDLLNQYSGELTIKDRDKGLPVAIFTFSLDTDNVTAVIWHTAFGANPSDAP